MKRLALASALVLTLSLGACATPTVVQVEQPGDRAMSCEQLAAAVDETNRFEQEARRERGVTGTNVAAAILFWPALAGTYMNTEEAIRAAESRRNHLNTLRRSKNCA